MPCAGELAVRNCITLHATAWDRGGNQTPDRLCTEPLVAHNELLSLDIYHYTCIMNCPGNLLHGRAEVQAAVLSGLKRAGCCRPFVPRRVVHAAPERHESDFSTALTKEIAGKGCPENTRRNGDMAAGPCGPSQSQTGGFDSAFCRTGGSQMTEKREKRQFTAARRHLRRVSSRLRRVLGVVCRLHRTRRPAGIGAGAALAVRALSDRSPPVTARYRARRKTTHNPRLRNEPKLSQEFV